MDHIPFIRPLQPWRRIDQYAMSVRPLRRTDVYPKLLELYTDPDDPCPVFNEGLPPSPSEDFLDEDGSYLLRFLGIVESQPSSSSDNDDGVSTYQDHKDSDVHVETVKDQSASYHGSTESNNLSLKHNPQETSVESGPRVYRWKRKEWLRHPGLYCKYMEKYLYMPLEDDFATIPSSPRPSCGEVNGVVPDLLELVEQIEYYFSFDNLIHDVNFREHMNYHGGWVALPFLASLPEVMELTLNVKVIEEALKTLSFLIEFKDGTKLIRHRRSWQRWIPATLYGPMN